MKQMLLLRALALGGGPGALMLSQGSLGILGFLAVCRLLGEGFCRINSRLTEQHSSSGPVHLERVKTI